MWRAVAALGAVGIVACAVEGPPEDGNNWWDGTGVGTSTSGATSGAGGADLTPPPNDGGNASTSGSGSSDPGSGGQSSGSGDPPPPPPPNGCQPDPNDLPCLGCLKQACCDALQLCQNDPACQCWEACLQQGNIAACIGQCSLPSNLDPLLNCVQNDCLATCVP